MVAWYPSKLSENGQKFIPVPIYCLQVIIIDQFISHTCLCDDLLTPLKINYLIATQLFDYHNYLLSTQVILLSNQDALPYFKVLLLSDLIAFIFIIRFQQ